MTGSDGMDRQGGIATQHMEGYKNAKIPCQRRRHTLCGIRAAYAAAGDGRMYAMHPLPRGAGRHAISRYDETGAPARAGMRSRWEFPVTSVSVSQGRSR